MVTRGEGSRMKGEKGEGGNKRYRFQVIKSVSHRDIICSKWNIVIIL